MNWFSRKVRAWRISNTLKADFCLEPLTRPAEQDDPLRPRPVNMIDPRHELVKLTGLITWEVFGWEWSEFFPSATGLIQLPSHPWSRGFCISPIGCRTRPWSPDGSRIPKSLIRN